MFVYDCFSGDSALQRLVACKVCRHLPDDESDDQGDPADERSEEFQRQTVVGRRRVVETQMARGRLPLNVAEVPADAAEVGDGRCGRVRPRNWSAFRLSGSRCGLSVIDRRCCMPPFTGDPSQPVRNLIRQYFIEKAEGQHLPGCLNGRSVIERKMQTWRQAPGGCQALGGKAANGRGPTVSGAGNIR